MSLKITNTTGYDEISNHLLKLSSPYIISPLMHICNAVLNCSVFPDRLKSAIVRPIHKKGNTQDISNYKPLSLLTSFSKVFEKPVYTRIYRYLTINNILSKQQFGMSSASYALSHMKYSLPVDSLTVIHFAHVHTVMSYGIIFWGYSTAATKVFLLQKKILRIISKVKPRELFKNMQIMTLYLLYIYSLVLFVVNNKHLFAFNNGIHKYNIRNNTNFHFPSVHFTKVCKGPFITGIRLYNHLPQIIKTLDHNSKKFKTSLKRFFHQHPFYSTEEYFEYIDELP